ncbi:MAG TPA: ABC transporter ATP-binding protein [Candidatus Paceibacterota bacterium]|jgi:ATP-binding cassette subfamily B protein|nr:ABC transporter ATP-binding protein [Candidatus Paceibacterota bacterium]
MKKVLTTYWIHTEGIRRFGVLTMIFITLAMLFRDILRPLAMKNVIDGLTVHKFDHPYIWKQFGLFALFHFGAQLWFRISGRSKVWFELNQMRILRNLSFTTMITRSLEFFLTNPSGSLVAKQKRFVGAAEVLFDELNDKYIQLTIQTIGVSIVMYFVSPIIMGIVLIWILFYFLNARMSSKKRLAFGYAESAVESEVTGMYADVAANMPTVKAFGMIEEELSRFDSLTKKHFKAFKRAWNYAEKQHAIQSIFSFIIHVGCFGLAIFFWMYHGMTTGQVILVSIYAGQLSSSFWDFGKTLKRYMRCITDAEEMVDIIDIPLTIHDYSGAYQKISLLPADASIEFNSVHFSYDPKIPIFDHFSLHIPAGQKVAIIGSTGAGKSTLIKLIQRNADPQYGAIYIGPYNIKTDITQRALKRCISIVPQTINLFNRSIAENIAYGKQDATLDEIMTAAKKAFIHDFIMDLPRQYQTSVSENGANFSGGQRQRIAIARAILHDAPIVIFDEATSSVDNIMERQLQQILQTELKDKTFITVAHRLSTVRHCERIIVLENGAIVQDGTHEQLAADTDGIYYRMLNSPEDAEKEEIFSN